MVGSHLPCARSSSPRRLALFLPNKRSLSSRRTLSASRASCHSSLSQPVAAPQLHTPTCHASMARFPYPQPLTLAFHSQCNLHVYRRGCASHFTHTPIKTAAQIACCCPVNCQAQCLRAPAFFKCTPFVTNAVASSSKPERSQCMAREFQKAGLKFGHSS